LLQSFDSRLRVAVVGASGGIGASLVSALSKSDRVADVYALARRPDQIASTPRTMPLICDYDAPQTLTLAAESMGQAGPLDLVIVATGILHDDSISPEKDWRHIDADVMARVLYLNTVGPSLAARHFLPLLHKNKRSVFAALAARVGSISDNRIGGWYSYRASKAALVMIIKSLAIELERKKRETICVTLHPGTVDSRLSKPFQGSTRPGQVVGSDVAAGHLLQVIDDLEASDSGHQIAWDGQRIPA